MIEGIYRDVGVIRRLRSGSLGLVIEALAAHLVARGHRPRTVREYLRGVGHFATWVDRKHVARDAIDEDLVRVFLWEHLAGRPRSARRAGSVTGLRAALHHLLVVLHPTTQSDECAPATGPATDPIALEFQGYLREVRGASEATCREYLRTVQRFLQQRHHDGAFDPAALVPKDLTDFVAAAASKWQPGTAQLVATALRSFLRFLQLRGLRIESLLAAVPTVANWKLARLPKALSDTQLTALLAAFDRATPAGRRDYALAMCLVGLGLRAGEVAALVLEDFDWRAGIVRIAAGKTRRASSLPLPPSVGRALIAYLADGRPPTHDRHVFVRHALPVGAPLGAGGTRAAIRRAFGRAGLPPEARGTHVLRHTAASRMVRGGASLKEVADVLRHRSLDTTQIYTKVDLPALRDVALPWPEVLR